MKKYIILSLFAVSSAFIYAMENNSFAFSIVSYLPSFSGWFSFNQIQHESTLITELRKSKNEFEMKLETWPRKDFGDFFHSIFGYSYFPTTTLWLVTNHTCLERIDTAPGYVLKQYQSERKNGYSALGAIMIAKYSYYDKSDISLTEKCYFVQELTIRGFKLTPKDRELAKLVLYDHIINNKKTVLHLLYPDFKANWSILPKEIKIQIAQIMVQLFKNDFRILPKTSLNNFIES